MHRQHQSLLLSDRFYFEQRQTLAFSFRTMSDSDDDIALNLLDRPCLAAENGKGMLDVCDNDYMESILITFDDLNTIVNEVVAENANNASRDRRSRRVQAQFKRPTPLATPGAQKQISRSHKYGSRKQNLARASTSRKPSTVHSFPVSVQRPLTRQKAYQDAQNSRFGEFRNRWGKTGDEDEYTYYVSVPREMRPGASLAEQRNIQQSNLASSSAPQSNQKDDAGTDSDEITPQIYTQNK